jgi:hypothetical protein
MLPVALPLSEPTTGLNSVVATTWEGGRSLWDSPAEPGDNCGQPRPMPPAAPLLPLKGGAAAAPCCSLPRSFRLVVAAVIVRPRCYERTRVHPFRVRVALSTCLDWLPQHCEQTYIRPMQFRVCHALDQFC